MGMSIYAKLRPRARYEAGKGQDWLSRKHPGGSTVNYWAVRAIQDYDHRLRVRWDNETRRYELWEVTPAGPDYIMTWQGPNHEFRYVTGSGIIAELRTRDWSKLSRYEQSADYLDGLDRAREEKKEEEKKIRREELIHSAEKEWGWRDNSFGELAREED